VLPRRDVAGAEDPTRTSNRQSGLPPGDDELVARGRSFRLPRCRRPRKRSARLVAGA
jgi:hypothetical protein